MANGMWRAVALNRNSITATRLGRSATAQTGRHDALGGARTVKWQLRQALESVGAGTKWYLMVDRTTTSR